MTPEWILPALLGIAVVVACARLAWRQMRAPDGARARGWRIAVLAAMQPVCAGLLYLTLMPPAMTGPGGTLVVATANAPRLAAVDVALPEAPALPGVERVPDLATALRRRPGTRILRIVGDGLVARDRVAANGLALAFAPPEPQRGIVALAPPPPVAPGAAIRVGGRVEGVTGGAVELIDPAGARVDRQPVAGDGAFLLAGTARTAGPALFRVRVRGAGSAIVEEAEVPVIAEDVQSPRLLLLAGAPGPEIKYLRRWATDAGMAATTRIAAGGGVVLGDAPVTVDAATLARFDVAVVDERSWTALGSGARAALVAAVRGGMGLVVRATGPVPEATRRGWRSLGLSVGGGGTTVPAPLASGVPILTRRVIATSPLAVPIWRDGRGAVLADWRAVGRGRVAAWTAVDAFTLVLAGEGDRYGRAWSDVVAAVARPRATPAAIVSALPRVGERATICGVAPGARVGPGDPAALLVDPAGGSRSCAAFYPRETGWYRLTDRANGQSFYVYPADALPALRAAERTTATIGLVRARPSGATTVAAGATARGPSWPWFLALVVALGVLWWFERARITPRPAATAG